MRNMEGTDRSEATGHPGRNGNGTDEAWREREERFRAEIERLQDQLIQAEKLAGLGTLVSGMAHEINNPIQGILGMAELVLDEKDQAKVREYTRDIVEYSRHIAVVVSDFACYARPSAREEEVAVDLCERLAEAVKMVRRCPHFGHVEVALRLQPLPRLRARRVEIDQVFVNLLTNAVQAMGGRGRLELASEAQGGMMDVRISDSGCGIPQSLLDKIFDPFFTTKEPGQGTGLGLSIVSRIVTKYGGTIAVESEQGKGSTFTVRFPLDNHREEVAMEWQDPVTADENQGRVLVVDDVAAVRKSIRTILASAGYEVVEAEDGEQAIGMLEQMEDALPIDAILCDLRLPHMHGAEAIAYIRNRYPAMPVVVLTGYPDVELAVSLMRKGVLDFLVKPVLADELLTVIKRAVGQSVMRKDRVASS